MKCLPVSKCKNVCPLRYHDSCSHYGEYFLRAIMKKDDEKPFPEWCPLPDCACPVAAKEQMKS